jgi:hypothetical protein
MPDVSSDFDQHFEAGFKELEVVAYISDFRIEGVAHFGSTGRSTSRRSSDYIRQFKDPRLTLSDVSIFAKAGRDLIDKAPFIILSMDKVDFIYAREESGGADQPG